MSGRILTGSSSNSVDDLSQYSPKKYLIVKNAHQNNLSNIDVVVEHGKIIVITGVSGSGKSSLAFETLYEEGRRRYVESLSSYARQFLGKMKKPLVDYIKGLPPAIAIEQRKSSSNSRSTVGTSTEIHHYLKMLFARTGKIYSPISGKEVQRQSIDDTVDYVLTAGEGNKVSILCPIYNNNNRDFIEEVNILLQKGFTRIFYENSEYLIDDIITEKTDLKDGFVDKESVFIVIDRLIINEIDADLKTRVADSVQTACHESGGKCLIRINSNDPVLFSDILEADGLVFDEPVPDLFSFNSPYGACPECGGFGDTLGIDENKVIPNTSLSIYDKAVSCWEGEKMGEWRKEFIQKAPEFGFRIFEPYKKLTEEEKNLLWEGNEIVQGIMDFCKMLESNNYKIHYRILLSRLKGKTVCRACKGSRLRKEASYVKICKKSLNELLLMPIDELWQLLQQFSKELSHNKAAVSLLKEINSRVEMMVNIGLGYLTLNRSSRTLSGGESQRIQLIYAMGSKLTGTLYILDEPSIGLHPKDTKQLIDVLMELKQLGNTIIVVEHDEDIIRHADEIIDLGPGAGYLGGNIVFQGNYRNDYHNPVGFTADYLNGKLKIPIRKKRNFLNEFLQIKGASKHNLQNIDVKIPFYAMTVICGVSGSGKTTLVSDIIYESLKPLSDSMPPDFIGCSKIEILKYDENYQAETKPEQASQILSNFYKIDRIEFVSQDSIDRSRRSNAVTYLKVFDAIRELMSSTPAAKMNGFTPAYFSFNVDGGRCEECKGDGTITVEMQFLADMNLQCDECKGKRYKQDILEVKYKEKNIDDILNLTVIEAIEFFKDHKAIVTGLEPLVKTGLDYLKLGQSTSSLSGGEAQRLKLAGFLSKGFKNSGHSIFIFDEPTTGLHWHDIQKLLNSFEELLTNGHTIIIIEHNLEVIKNADYLIELGPGGGKHGGNIIFSGFSELILNNKDSVIAEFLKEKM